MKIIKQSRVCYNYNIKSNNFCCKEMKEAFYDAIHLDDNGKLYFECLHYRHFNINYCPFCGKKIEVEL